MRSIVRVRLGSVSPSRPGDRALRIRILWALLAAYLAATAVHIGSVMAHEPFSFDAWNVAMDTAARPITAHRFFDYVRYEYVHSNPRFGQALTYLAYKVQWFAEIATPLAYLALSLAITVLGLGRWPKRGRELAMWMIAIGFGWFAFPQIGRNMFCRAYGANYVYGAAIQLWFLAYLRLGMVRPGEAAALPRLKLAMFGVIAGMCNEHTGPALIAFLAGHAWWLRRAGKPHGLSIAGALGVLLGFAVIFFAPGQAERYDGLAQRASLPERLFERGVTGNLDILRDYLVYAAPLLLLIVVVLIGELADTDPAEPERRAARGRALRAIGLALGAGVVIAATLGASPKLGSRFYIAPLAILLAGFIALLDAVVATPRRLAPLVALAVAASAYAGFRTIPLFARVADQGAARMRALEASTPGSKFVADAWDQVGESWWFIGDDFRTVEKREMVARYFGLARVSLRGYDPKAPLGTLGARVAPRYRAGGTTMEDAAFDLRAIEGVDLAAIHRTTRASIERLRGRIAPAALDRFELAVEFDGQRPLLPRHSLAISRWTRGGFEGYAAKLAPSRGGVLELELPAELAGKPFEIYLTRVGGEVRKLGTTDGGRLRYAPRRSGVFWALACDATTCLVIAVSR
jgi:hypothetical protein